MESTSPTSHQAAPNSTGPRRIVWRPSSVIQGGRLDVPKSGTLSLGAAAVAHASEPSQAAAPTAESNTESGQMTFGW